MNNDIKLIKKCSICDRDVLIDQYGNGRCEFCGWEQDEDSLDYPDMVRYPNRVSYNKARRLFKQGKPLVPSFQDFIEMFRFYGEVEFWYRERNFGLTASDGHTIEFFEDGNEESLQLYENIEDFKENAHIKEELLSNIWGEIKKATYMGCVEDI